jgi:hypothetical protein
LGATTSVAGVEVDDDEEADVDDDDEERLRRALAAFGRPVILVDK